MPKIKLLILSVISVFFLHTCYTQASYADSTPKISSKKKYRKDSSRYHNFGAGIRYHREHSHFEDLPYSDGDLSYSLSYEFHEGIGYWLFGVGYTPSIDEEPSIESVITPEISLIIQDRFFRAGVGALKSFIDDKNDIYEDTSIYYQFTLGVTVPLFSKFSLDLSTLYCFEKWGDIKFKVEDIEYGLIINYNFL